ncbi:MAG: class I SAM-dependent methyltransferase [Candidatus Dormibacteria bacterium]
MADQIFADRRLVQLYDPLDPDRSDLDAYAAIADEFDAQSLLDIGCGTGTWACRFATQGREVTGLDPAAASLEVAQSRLGGDRVRWIHGDVTALPPLQVNLATMTGNVAQVFLTDREWLSVLRRARASLGPGGRLVFEVRNPAKEAWRDWNRRQTYRRAEITGQGPIETWVELTEVNGQLVSFQSTFVFGDTGEILTSASTLRFRDREQITESLALAHLAVVEVRDAPDRPSQEFVFVAQRVPDASEPFGEVTG